VAHHVFLSPGIFGFARFAAYDYFAHVERALTERFAAAGQGLELHVVDVLPTASVRRRAAALAIGIAKVAADGPIHLLGHSTGGLDARLVASPMAVLPVLPAALAWLPRLRSVTTMNTPHFGTPLASFFVTSNGQRVLYALSVFTILGLSLGARPLAAASLLIRVLRSGEQASGLESRLLDRSIESLLGVVDSARTPELKAFLKGITEDQGAMLQLSPEAMDMAVAGFGDRPGVAYQSTASMAPATTARHWLRTIGHPWQAISQTLFTALHGITARHDRRYPCARLGASGGVEAGQATEAALARTFGAPPDLGANDGIVPLRSQLWGKLAWSGLADHLDVLGHFRGESAPTETRNVDWLTSGSGFGKAQFAALLDAIVAGMLAAT